MKKKEVIIGLVLAFLMCFSSVGAAVIADTTKGASVASSLGSVASTTGTSVGTSSSAVTSGNLLTSAQCNDYQDNDGDGEIDYGGGCDCDGDGELDSFIGKGDSAIIGSFCASETSDETISSYNTNYGASVENECPGEGVLYTSDDECDDEDDTSEGLTSEESVFSIELGDDVTENSIKTATNGDNIVVVYEINGNVYYKLYNFDSGLISEGEVASCTDGMQQNPAVAMNGEGEFVIAWDTDASEAAGTDETCDLVYGRYSVDTGTEIAVKVFDAEGTVLDIPDNEYGNEGEFVVNNHLFDVTEDPDKNWWGGLGYDGKPSVAMYEENIVVAWQAEDKSDGTYGVYSKIYQIDGSQVDKVSAYDRCSEETAESCNGAVGNEIALFSNMDAGKKNVDLVAGELEDIEVFVATWRNYENDEHKPIVRVFSLEDGTPLTNSRNGLDESDTLSKTVYPKVELSYGSDNYIVLAWHDNDKKSIDYSTFELGAEMQQTSTGGFVRPLTALADRESTLVSSGSLSADCHYLQDLEIPQTGSVASSTYKKGMVSVVSYEGSYEGTCVEDYLDADVGNAYVDLYFLDSFSDDGEITGEAMNLAGQFSSGGGVYLYPRLGSRAGDGFYVVYGRSDEISLMKYGFDGKQDALTIGGSESDDSGTPGFAGSRLGGFDFNLGGSSGCEYIGCDCDENGYLEEGYSYEDGGYGADIPSWCVEDPNSGSTLASSAICTDQAGTWYDEDSTECALGEEGDQPTATGYCADGIDNDGDGRMDFHGGCDVDADNVLDWTCEDKVNFSGCYSDCQAANGRFYLRDAGCLATGDTEYARCSDGYDNDNDGYVDSLGGCDSDSDGFVDYHCGCDEDGDGDLVFSEFGLSSSECSSGVTWGCKSAGFATEVSMQIDVYECSNYYYPDPECVNSGDDSERDSDYQVYGIGTVTAEEAGLQYAAEDEGSWWSNLLDFIF